MLSSSPPAADPTEVVRLCEAAIRAGEPPGLRALLAELGAPVLDLAPTALSARVMALAAEQGVAFYHHELRRRIPVVESSAPEVAVWEGDSVPAWTDGVLEEPKYFSFFLDSRLAPYNPVHRRKWRAHEALHALVGFAWRPQMTRFECYVGARLSELLPVVHWYGLDEVLRPRCPLHAGQLLYRELCPACEARDRLYWEIEVDEPLRASGRYFALVAADHLAAELGAARREIGSGRRVLGGEGPLRRLEGSSDAVGYLRGHWNRLTAWSFGAFVERFLEPGVDYCEAPSELADRVEAIYARILGGETRPDRGRCRALRARRALQDIGYRALQAAEWLDEDDPERAARDVGLLAALDEAGAAAVALQRGEIGEEAGWQAAEILLGAVAAKAHRLPAPVAAAWAGLGYRFWRREACVAAAVPQLAAGLESAFPALIGEIDLAGEPEDHAAAFAGSAAFDAPGSFGERFAAWSKNALESDLSAALRLEAWLQAPPRRDEDADLFAAVPEEGDPLPPESLRLNPTFRQARFPAAAIAAVLGEEIDAPDAAVAAAWLDGEPGVVLLDEDTEAALSAVAAGLPADREAFEPLIGAGIVLWSPVLR